MCRPLYPLQPPRTHANFVDSLWLQKLVLLDLYSKLIRDMPHSILIIRSYLFVFFCTYVTVQVLNVSECNPVYLYWQVQPDPGMFSTTVTFY